MVWDSIESLLSSRHTPCAVTSKTIGFKKRAEDGALKEFRKSFTKDQTLHGTRRPEHYQHQRACFPPLNEW
jgi:hypothetical protein